MKQITGFRAISARIACTTIGMGALVQAVFWNPLVLRPRFWNASVVTREIGIETALISVGLGLLSLRKWSALVTSAIAFWLAITYFRNSPPDAKLGFTLVLTMVPIAMAVGWPAFVWGNKRRDLLYVVVAALTSVVTVGIAFLTQTR